MTKGKKINFERVKLRRETLEIVLNNRYLILE